MDRLGYSQKSIFSQNTIQSWTKLKATQISVGLAATVPWLDLLVSLLGAIKMSTLSLMAPALIGKQRRLDL